MVVKAMNVDKLFRTRRLLLHYRQKFQVLSNNYYYFLDPKSVKIEFKLLTAGSLLQSCVCFCFLVVFMIGKVLKNHRNKICGNEIQNLQ